MNPDGGSEITIAMAEQILSELRDLGLQATPHAFAVWHAHAMGSDALLSASIRELMHTLKLDDAAMEQLHDTHVRSTMALRMAERSSRAIMLEIDGIVELIKLSLGSATQFGSTLSTLLRDLVQTSDPGALREIVGTLVTAAEETRQVNVTLEKGLRSARTEIDDLRKMLEDTRVASLTDALTGISNRKHLDISLEQALDAANASRTPFALLMIDIDHFKQFNDQHGHLTGDKVLKVVAQALKSKFQGRATVARFGGEEFAVIVPNGDLTSGWVSAEAARHSIMARELVKRSSGERIGRISISVGVAAWRRQDTALRIIARADAALMHAKRMGRNRTVTEEQLQEQSAKRAG